MNLSGQGKRYDASVTRGLPLRYGRVVNVKARIREHVPLRLYEAASAIYRAMVPRSPNWLPYLGELRSLPQIGSSDAPAGATDNLLSHLAERCGASKRMHGYMPHYHLHFAGRRERVSNVIEIGVQSRASVMMWEEYFPRATIHGIDIDPACKAFEGDRRRIHIGDQKETQFLRSILSAMDGPPDVIIDDGEHTEEAILRSFCTFLPAMSPHGIYAVEDLAANHPAVPFFLELEKSINYWPAGFPGQRWRQLWTFQNDERATWLDRNIAGLHFYRHLCIVERGFNPEDNPYLIRSPGVPSQS